MRLSSELQSRLEANSALNRLFERSKAIVPVDAGHDFFHVLRVAEGTAKIFKDELNRKSGRVATPPQLDNCFAAALLHDCVPIPKNSPLRKESSRLSSEKASEWLKEMNWPADAILEIQAAILDHSYSSGRTPQSLLGKSLQDADRLEAVGALGLYRTIATGVSMNAQLFDAVDPWAERRDLDDKRFSIDHFYTKLLKLHLTFQTEAAKAEALSRTKFLEQFLFQLRHEIES